MTFPIIIASAVIICCVMANRFSTKMGMPALILFMALGMIFGSDGIFKIPFDNFNLAQWICNISLLFIMFYGGFCTKWSTAKPVALRAAVLSTFGVVITALLTAVFCFFVLKFTFIGSLLAGAVISSTDAASVFSILRSKKLNLKYGTASLLEIESGSNDPVSFMLTTIGLSLINTSGEKNILFMIFSQIIFGISSGIVVAAFGNYFLCKKKLIPSGMENIFMIGLALLGYGAADLIGGNGYLSVYLMGIILGNCRIKNKKDLVLFFDGITGLAQIILFFLLGLLAFPSRLPQVLPAAIAIALFLLFVARPAAIFLLLKPFKATNSQCLLISWAGLRGAASIVFAISVISGGGIQSVHYDIFHIVFMISLLSVAFQGSLLPLVAKKLDMVDEESDVRKTFNDYQEESAITLMRIFVPKGHNWANRPIKDVSLPTDSLAIMIKRAGETVIPNGDTIILEGDSVILSVPSYDASGEANLDEIKIDKNHEWCEKKIADLDIPENTLIVMVRRGDETIIPRGKTVIHKDDVVITYQ